ncbi:unnamed protein product [Staurois parvus]|uniref:Uncharacterized protein n=1 Tax=Staurois parvus TaxID=386267 RepID=A0ABN9EBN5_9NEOB|nr:unnamed protein product [Staurois parvus]
MVGVTGQVQQRDGQTSQGSEQGQQRIRQEQRAGTGYRAQEKHNTKAESASLAIP